MVGTAQDAAAEGGEGTLVWGMPAETDILDPHATGGWLTYDVTYQIFESFAKEDLTDPNAATPELIPALATSWEISEDGLEYTFYLREGVKFHDGTPFDAAVAKFNFDRFWNESSPHFYAKSKAFVAAYTRWIENVEVIDDMTIKVALNAPNYEWIRSGLQSYGQPLMISPTAVETFGNEGVALNPIGTGPFKFVEREQGVKTVIERNPDYWGRKAKLDRVIFRPLEDPATRINALRTGEIDMTNTPPWDDIQDLVDEGFHLTINENVPFIWFIHLKQQAPDPAGRARTARDEHGRRPRESGAGDLRWHGPDGIRHALAGKSTTARLILRLIEPTSGSVTLDGVDVLGSSGGVLRRLRREMQIVFQDPLSSLNPRMTVGENIAIQLYYHGIGNRLERIQAGQRAFGGRGSARGRLRPLPARVLGRPVPARRHRAGAALSAPSSSSSTSRSPLSMCRSALRSCSSCWSSSRTTSSPTSSSRTTSAS